MEEPPAQGDILIVEDIRSSQVRFDRSARGRGPPRAGGSLWAHRVHFRLVCSLRMSSDQVPNPPWGSIPKSTETYGSVFGAMLSPSINPAVQWRMGRPGRPFPGPGRSRDYSLGLPQIPTCGLPASGSSSQDFATGAIRWLCGDTGQVSVYLPWFQSTAHETASPSLARVPQVGSPGSTVL